MANAIIIKEDVDVDLVQQHVYYGVCGYGNTKKWEEMLTPSLPLLFHLTHVRQMSPGALYLICGTACYEIV